MGLPPTTARFEEKRELILNGAARIFNLQGIKGATLADIAASVGLATNSLTYYYRKKEALAAACLLRSMAAVEAHAAAALPAATVAERVHRFIGAYVGMLAAIAQGRHPEMVVFNDVRAITPPHDAAVFNAYTQMFRSVRALLRGPETAALTREALNARAHLLLSLTTWIRAWLHRYEPDDHAEIGERMAGVLLQGLASPGQRWSAARSATAWPAAAPADDADTREFFLRAATRLVNEHGYHGASVERISSELKLTKGSFYHHHETKDELISACFDRTFAAVRAAQAAATAHTGSGWQRLVLACRLLVRYQMSEQGPLLRVSAWSALPEALRRDQLRTMTRLGERFSRFILEGMTDGSMRIVDPSVAAQMVSGMINAAAELERWVPGLADRARRPGSAADDEAAWLYARPLLEGLLTD